MALRNKVSILWSLPERCDSCASSGINRGAGLQAGQCVANPGFWGRSWNSVAHSTHIRFIYASSAAFNVPRIHSDTVCFLALAAAVTFFKSSALNRTGTILPLASPLASLGRPTFLGFFCAGISELLHNGRAQYCDYRDLLVRVEHVRHINLNAINVLQKYAGVKYFL